MKLKLNTAQQSSLKLVEARLHLVVLNWIIVTKELTCKYIHGWGGDGLIGYKANLSPAKLKLADIGLELSLAKILSVKLKDIFSQQI